MDKKLYYREFLVEMLELKTFLTLGKVSQNRYNQLEWDFINAYDDYVEVQDKLNTIINEIKKIKE